MQLYLKTNIKHLRIKSNLTQTELANRTDTSKTTIQKYEYGDRTPRIEHIVTLAQIFDVTLDDFVLKDLTK